MNCPAETNAYTELIHRLGERDKTIVCSILLYLTFTLRVNNAILHEYTLISCLTLNYYCNQYCVRLSVCIKTLHNQSLTLLNQSMLLLARQGRVFVHWVQRLAETNDYTTKPEQCTIRNRYTHYIILGALYYYYYI